MEDSQASPVRPSDNSNVEMKMTTAGMTLTEKVLGEKPLPVPLCPSQIILTWD
jgi:hypothetical protein